MRAYSLLLIFVFVQAFGTDKAGAVIGGEAAHPSAWSSVLLFGSGNRYCSAVTVGPRVFLTAAHCVQTRPELQSDLTWAEVGDVTAEYHILCNVEPQYSSTPSLDYALCRTDRPLAVGQIERIPQHSSTIPAGSPLVLVGYGCRDKLTWVIDGHLSMGHALVVKPVKESGYLLTAGDGGCLGDGGGGAFLVQSASRTLVGVISLVDNDTRTWIAPLGVKGFLNWATDWAQKNSVFICGIATDEATACTPRPYQAPKVPSSALNIASVIIANSTSASAIVARDQPAGELQLRTIAYQKGETLRDVAILTCPGSADENFFRRTIEYLTSTKQTFDKGQPFNKDGNLTIPVCPDPANTPPTMTLQIGPNDKRSLWYYFTKLQTDRKDFGNLWAWSNPKHQGQPRRDSVFFEEAFKALNPSQNPDALESGKIVLPLRPESLGIEASAPTDTGEVYDPIPDIVYQSSQTACSKSQDLLQYPFDIIAVLDVLGDNADARRSNATRSIPKPAPTDIVIVDSGLLDAGSDTGPFPKRMLRVSTREPAEQDYTSMRPRLVNPEDAAHGTWVATASLGGALFAHVLAAMPESPINLDPERVYDGWSGRVVVPKNTVDSILANLPAESRRLIVNMSFTATDELARMHDMLGPRQTNILFVDAAGNGAGDGTNNQGQNLEGARHYPACYGGFNKAGAANLISVAAVYRDDQRIWKPAPFSDFDSEFVEIGAPGCAVPVLNYDSQKHAWDSQPKLVNGTSFSAPLVSFAAGMIWSEYPDLNASEVKQRILAASDLNPQLSGKITDGRILNLIKSLAIFNDVLETNEGTQIGTLQFRDEKSGAAKDWSQNLPATCIDPETRAIRDGIPLASLLKIVPRFNVDNDKYPDLIYVSDLETNEPHPLDCKLSDDVGVYFSHLGSDSTPRYNWNEIRDLVLRLPQVRYTDD